MTRRRFRLQRADVPLTTGSVRSDALTDKVMKAFDIETPDTSFYPWDLGSLIPEDWGIGLIVGASGTGKSTLLTKWGVTDTPIWGRRSAVLSHFASSEDAIERLGAVGLNSVPTWAKPYHVLSTGEKFRVDLARQLGDDAVIDEYTSVVSRSVAKSASRSLRGWAKRTGARRMVFATCHRDVIDWLQPDWLIDTDAGTLDRGGIRHHEQWWMEFVEDPAGNLKCSS